MAFHVTRRNEFLAQNADEAALADLPTKYGVTLLPAEVAAGQVFWRVIGVHHLTPEENQGKHAVYVDALDSAGERVDDPTLRVHWGWAGQRADEMAPPRALDKPDNEPAANVEMYGGQIVWVELGGDGLPSERVAGMHTAHADEPGPGGENWNSYGHHSFYVVFQRTVAGVVTPEIETEPNGTTPDPGTPQPPVIEPAPTEPPVVEPPVTVPPVAPPLPVAAGNKLGFYLHDSTDQNNLWEAVSRVQPPVILVHADTANTMLLQDIRRFRAPNAFVIGRMYVDNHEQRMMLESNPEENGRRFADKILSYDFGLAMRQGENGRPLIDAWMGLNETVPGPNSEQFKQKPEETARLLRNYDRFQVAFRRRLQEFGVEAVAFNFGAGNFIEAAHYLDYFPDTLREYIYLGFHEYGWPTMFPAPDSATSAGTYRPCLAGIRDQFGDQHRVIITEAGLTRMYQYAPWGDKGWLNVDAPLTEEEYWQSLAWYNQHMLEDEYVLGACLYEVGHHGQWETFRHLGRTDSGDEITLINRIVALKDAAMAPAAMPAQPTPVATPEPIAIRGRVTLQGLAVAGASVRLIGGQETLGAMRGAALDAPNYVTWSRRVDDASGSLWAVWQSSVAQEVAGITWPEFKRQAPRFNPELAESDGEFVAGQRYWLPENQGIETTIAWDRPLTGVEGNPWQIWLQAVQNKVVGLDYSAFKKLAYFHNPDLAEDDGYLAAKRYNLPRNADHTRYALQTWTHSRGGFTFADLPPGSYELLITAPGALPYRTGFSCDEDLEINVRLLPTVLPAPAEVAAISGGPSHDFVRTHGTEFVEQGRLFRFIGVNIRGLVHYGDTKTLRYAESKHRMEQLQAAYDMGARVVRVFLPSMHVDVETTIRNLQGIVDLLRRDFPGLYILPAFANLYADVPFRIPGDERFYAKIDPNFPADLLTSDFFGGGYTENYLPYLRKVVTAFKDEPAIFAWEVGNELKLDPADVGLPRLYTFIDFMRLAAREIRALDTNHLITTGMISTRHASLGNEMLQRRLYDKSAFDFMTIHCYNEEYHEDESGLAQLLGMPYIVEEAGFGNKYGHDRSGHIQRDMDHWFGAGDGARGYMQWGFMATSNDIGDGDRDSGMDRVLHHDWDALFALYRTRAGDLARNRPEVTLPPRPVKPPKPSGFEKDSVLYTHTIVNLRATPGYLGKDLSDVLGQIAYGASVTILGAAKTQDDLVWWPVRAQLTDGSTVEGWAAESIPGQLLISPALPPAALPMLASRPMSIG